MYITSHTGHKKKQCTEVSLSAFTLQNLTMLTANDKRSAALSILREVNLAKHI